jgi:putative redox protein
MVSIETVYQGALRAQSTHGPSGTQLITDAPVDNHGKGESFSPTDLLATATGTCMLTTVGIVAERHGWDIGGSSVHVVKEMVADPERRVGRLVLRLCLPKELDERARKTLEKTALNCPVVKSLAPGVELETSFEWNAVSVTG